MPQMFNAYLFWGMVAGHVVNIGLQGMNALDPSPLTASGIYLCGLIWYLVHGAVQFSRILFVHPRS
jgi:hypothetical protein